MGRSVATIDEERVRDVEEAIRQRVADQAPTWFEGTGSTPVVRLLPLAVRPRARLYAVHVGDGDGKPQVLAKVRRDWSDQSGAAGAGARPRLARSLATATEQTALEYAGLTEIHRIFGPDSGDERFFAVRPLDLLVAEQTLIMEYVEAATLRTHLRRLSRLPTARAGRRDIGDPWRHAGTWLGVFQREMPCGAQPARQATREEVAERFDAYGEFLGCRLGPRAVGGLARDAAELALQVLPGQVSLAVGHGDYAPRNVFVRPGSRLSVFDPMPRWRVPRYDDLARFLVTIRLSGMQVHTRGAAFSSRTLELIEGLVLDGYRAEAELVSAELRCFQLLVVLDRWSALVGSQAIGWHRRWRTAPVELASSHLRREGQRLLDLARSAA